MKRNACWLLLLITHFAQAQLTVKNLRCEHRLQPLVIDAVHPRFSWQITSTASGTLQTGYEIRLLQEKKIVWNSGRVSSDSSVAVAYQGQALQSALPYRWQVRVFDNHHQSSAWAFAGFQMSLLQPSDWSAKWIAPDSTLTGIPVLRKIFQTKKPVRSATAFITAHGLYEAKLNESRIGEAYLTPGWTSYHTRLQYQAYDLTSQLHAGQNVLDITLANGWYRGPLTWDKMRDVFGKDLALLFQLQIVYMDGSQEIIGSDKSWQAAESDIRKAEIYDGETIDHRENKPVWTNAVEIAGLFENLIATGNEPVTKHETFTPVHIFKTPKGETIVDFGQNLVGWVMLNVSGKSGDSIKISHAEVLDKAGNFYTDNLRHARAQDIYILAGGKTETFEPHFTFHGFRYIKIEGYPGDLKKEDLTAVALYSDMEPTGSFSCSNPLINQLQHNIQWGQKGNFLDVPTDCPQRDERLGWTGDAQVFSRTATYNMQVENFFAKWMKDVGADQVDGRVPFVVPNVLGPGAANSAGWADVATIVPWNVYLAYGDPTILADQFSSMKSYVESIRKVAVHDLWNSGFHFGDWLFFRPEDDNDGRAAVTDKYLIAQCFYAHSTQLLINAASVLHKTDDSVFYSQSLQKIKAAFVKEYLTPSGRLVSGTQTAYTLALNFDMLPDSLRKQAADRLVENIKSYDDHLTTGFLGTPYLCEVLTRFGHTDVAYKLLLQETYPSWLYPVKMGATTIWERWDGIKPDSSFQTPNMNSFNHYSYGAIGDWLYRSVAGIDTYDNGPGYKHIRIEPHPGGRLDQVDAELQSPYGLIAVHWKTKQQQFVLDISIPANTRATVLMPDGRRLELGSGRSHQESVWNPDQRN